MKPSYTIPAARPIVCIVPATASRSASFTGRGFSRTAESSDQVAAAAPIAQQRHDATIVAPGRLVSLRNASRSSSIRFSFARFVARG